MFSLVIAATGCGNRPVALVNGKPITGKELDEELRKQYGHKLLAGLIQRRMIDDAFKAAGLQLDPQEADKRVADEIKQQFPDEQAAREALAKSGLTMADLKTDAEVELKAQKLATKDVKYTDDDLKKYFAENHAMFDKPERVTISDIVVGSQAEADKVYALAVSGKTTFGDLARQYSLDMQSRTQGGLMPEAPVEAVPTVLRPILAPMQVGQVSKPLKLGTAPNFQFVLVKLEGRKAAEKATFEGVRADLETAYKRVKALQPAQLMDDLRKNAKVTIYDPKFKDLEAEFKVQDTSQLPSFGPQGGGQAPSGAAPGGAPGAGQAPAPPPAGK